MPPSVFRGERPAGGYWTPHDGVLAEALTVLEDSTCSGCGQPVWLCQDEVERAQWVPVGPVKCFACEAMHSRMSGAVQAHKHPDALRWGVYHHEVDAPSTVAARQRRAAREAQTS